MKVLEHADDVTDDILRATEDCVDWFEDEGRIPTEDFIDRLCSTYAEGWDIESYDNPATRKILRHARATMRDRKVA